MLLKDQLSRRTVLAGLGAGIGAGLGMAALPRSARAQDDKTLRIWTFLDPSAGKDPREKVFKKLIDSFEAANPGTKITVEPQIWHQMTDKFFAAHQTGTAPDIMWVIYFRIPAAVTLGALANLDELFAANNLWTKDDYDDMAGPYMEFGSREGKHFQITHSRSIAGMLYRTDLLKEAGIDADKVTTWQQFLDAATKLTVKDASGNVTRWGFGQVFTTVATQPSIAASILMDRDGSLFHPDGKARFNTPAGIEGMDFQVDLIRKYGVAPANALSLNGEDLYDQFTSGRNSIILSNTARVPRLRGIIGSDNVDYFPFPSFTEGKASPTEAQGWPIGVWSGSQKKDLAAKFLAHISSKEADTMWVTEAGAVPMRKSTVDGNPTFFADPSKQYLARIAKVMRESVWFVPEAPVGGWNEELDRAAQAILANNVPTAEALAKAEATYNANNGL